MARPGRVVQIPRVAATEADSGNAPVAVVFDVDGTLYHQKGLRRAMLRKLLLGAILSARTRADVRILKRFREIREGLGERVKSGYAVAQYEQTAQALGLPMERVKKAVEEWIFRRPLPYLLANRIPGIDLWLEQLRKSGVRPGVYSEYPAEEKLAALKLSFDAVVSSTDADVDAFKPHPRGIQVVLDRLGVAPQNALYVGDRLDRDRPCAEAAGVAFLAVGQGPGMAASFPPPDSLLPSFLKEAVTT